MSLGRWRGVALRVHPLFLLFLSLAVLGGQATPALVLLALLLTHEAAHLLVARAYGLTVTEVELLPFGGVARIDGLSESEPGVEAVVAAAGPLNNLLLLAVGLKLGEAGLLAPELADLFTEGNLALALFNLLPVLPLDGGRCVRGWLAAQLGFGNATRRLARWGQGVAIALALGGAGLLAAGWAAPNAFLLSGFLYLAARRELASSPWEEMRLVLKKQQRFRRQGVMVVHELVARADLPLAEVARHLAAGRYHLIWVVGDDLSALGLVEERTLLRALVEKGAGATLRELL